MSGTDVCVIIAAHNAAETITMAITSALREPEVSEVVVVDDASTDATEAVARASDDGSGRLLVLRLDVNRGPSCARNLAIRHSKAPLIAILDADDFFLPGRLARLIGGDDWDLVADNIVFVQAARDVTPGSVARFAADPGWLDPAQFIAGNISSRGARRGELGFLKPVMRRAMLERCGLGYDEELRLGEDYALYIRTMLMGARFKLIRSCGYCAVVRQNSLSGQHRTEDLRRLADADLSLLAVAGSDAAASSALRRHERHIRDKWRLRHFLDLKAACGLAGAMAFACATPASFRAVAQGVAMDKFEPLRRALSPRPQGGEPRTRYLIAGTAAAGDNRAAS